MGPLAERRRRCGGGGRAGGGCGRVRCGSSGRGRRGDGGTRRDVPHQAVFCTQSQEQERRQTEDAQRAAEAEATKLAELNALIKETARDRKKCNYKRRDRIRQAALEKVQAKYMEESHVGDAYRTWSMAGESTRPPDVPKDVPRLCDASVQCCAALE